MLVEPRLEFPKMATEFHVLDPRMRSAKTFRSRPAVDQIVIQLETATLILAPMGVLLLPALRLGGRLMFAADARGGQHHGHGRCVRREPLGGGGL